MVIDLCVLIPAMILQIFNSAGEIVIPIATSTEKANTKLETETNVRSNLRPCTVFYSFHLLNHYVLSLLKDNFFFLSLFSA